MVDRLQRLQPTLAAEQQARLHHLLQQFDAWRRLRSVDYVAAVRREMAGHLASWSWYLDNLARGEEAALEDYPREVWIRTRLQQLVAEAESLGVDVQAEVARLATLDRKLRSLVEPCPGAEQQLEAQEVGTSDAWWLHVRPRRSLSD